MALINNRGANKKDSILTVAFFLMILGVVILVINKDNLRAGFMKPIDIYADDADATRLKKGDAVTADIYAVLDTFGTLETTHTTNGTVTSRSYSYYYIIPVFDDYETYYIAVKVSSSDKRTFEKIADETWEYLYGERDDFTDKPFEYTGCLHKLKDEAYDYMINWFIEAEWFDTDSKSEIKKYVWPLCLESVYSFSSLRYVVIAGVVLVLAGIGLMALYFVKNKKNTAGAGTVNTQQPNFTPAPTQYDSTINIAGVKYMRSDFEAVNNYIMEGDKDNAIRAVRDRTGLTEEEARTIVDNWGLYY